MTAERKPMSETTLAEEPRCICLSPGLGVALAGAGARGIAQVGVLKVLDREGIAVEYVAGTSSGAVIGGLYALTGSAIEVERRVLDYLRRAESGDRPPLFGTARRLARSGHGPRSLVERFRSFWLLRRGLTQPALAAAEEITCALDELFEGQSFAETKIPFAATAADLNTGRRLIFASGHLREAVYASAALPGVVPPLEVNGYRLIDGGFGEPVPVDTCRYLGAGRVVAVDVFGQPLPSLQESRSALGVVLRADQIARYALEQEHLAKADVVITPEVHATDWMDFSQAEAHIAEGERAAETKLDEIRALIARFEQRFVRGSVVPRACHP